MKVRETYQREELKKRVFMEGVWKEPSERENMNESKRLEDTQLNIVYRGLGRLPRKSYEPHVFMVYPAPLTYLKVVPTFWIKS